MNFFKKGSKLFVLSFIFLFSFSSIIHCLIEIPVMKIKPSNIPKFPGFNPDTEIPEYIRDKILKKNPNISKDIINYNKLYSSSGKVKVITNILFIIDIKLGSTKQLFNLLVDTGSSITWVPKINCDDLYPPLHHYDPSLSSTSIKKDEDPFEIIYGTGSAKGDYYSDQLSYIEDKQFKMDFGAAEITNFNVPGADGILGLSQIYEDNDKSFIHMMCKAHVTKSKIFSVKLGLNSIQNLTGSFYIGKHEDFNKDSVVSCELNNENYYDINYWACSVLSFTMIDKINNIEVKSEKKISVIFDTGTNAIFLPYSYLKDITSQLDYMNCYIKQYLVIFQPDRYQIICFDRIPDFKINIGGHTFILQGNYFFTYEKGVYFSDIFFQDSYDYGDDVFIIGSPFFMVFHVLFDSYTKELFFYPEIEGTIIKGSWWNTKHIIVVVIFIIIVLFTSGSIIFFLIWRKRNKLELGQKMDDNFEIRTMFGLL